MKRPNPDTDGGGAVKCAKSDDGRGHRAVAAAVLAHCPAAAAPGRREAWGLDRLVLDDRWCEDSVRDLLRLGGSDLAPSEGVPLPQRNVLSLPGGCGQGLAVAAGLAAAQRHLAATYAQPDFDLFDHRVVLMCRSGALLSGVASETASLAGHLRLAGLVVVCGDDGALGGENAQQRFEAYGWAVVTAHSLASLATALEASKTAERATLVLVDLAAASAGAPEQDAEALRGVVERGSAAVASWRGLFVKYGETHAEAHTELVRRFAGQLPEGWTDGFPEYTVGERAQATRQYSAKVLASLVSALPEMIGGSADLTGSVLTNQAQLKDFQPGRPKGRYLRFGVREHAMVGLCTGLSAYGGFLPFCGTFMNFFTYAWGALRLACQAGAHVLYVATHDSIELGEDGPTHQPIEVLAACRALPNLLTLRPADGPETVGAYEVAVLLKRPALLALGRSGSPHLEGSGREKVAKGGYVLQDFEPGLVPGLVLAASGTEVHTCVEARGLLQSIGVGVRVVSLPCWELFEEQEEAYRRAVFDAPAGRQLTGLKPLRVYVEAQSPLGFHRYAEVHLGMPTFGASGPGNQVRKHFGFEKTAVATKAMEALKERGLVLSYKVGRFGFCKFGPKIIAALGD